VAVEQGVVASSPLGQLRGSRPPRLLRRAQLCGGQASALVCPPEEV